MKKILFSALLFISVNLFSQTTFSYSPQGINYQSVIRSSSGVALASTSVNVQFKLYEGVAGPLVYSETHNTTTNDYGMVNLIINNGSPDGAFSHASFEAINWGKQISYEIYINGSPAPIEPRKLFMSVPYALFAPAPTLSLTSGNILSSGPLSNAITLPTGTTYTNGAGISLGSGTVITNTAPDQIVSLNPGSNIGVSGTYPSFTISSPPYLLSNATPSIIVLSNGSSSSSISIPVGPTYSGTSGNISISSGSINLVTTGVVAGTYGIGSAVPSYSVDAFGRLKTSSNFTPTITGDVINTISTSTVAGLRGRPILATIPIVNQVLGYNGSAWTPTTIPTPLSYTGTPTTISVSPTGQISTLPSGVIPGVYGALIGNSVPVYTVDTYGRLTTSSQYTPSLNGDIINSINTTTVNKLRGIPLAPVPPTLNQVLSYNGTSWIPTSLATVPTITAAAAPNNNLTVSGGPAYTIGVPAYSFSTSTSGSTSNLTLFNGVNSFSGVLPSPVLSLSSGTLFSIGTSTVNLSNPTNGFWNVNGNSTTTVTSNFLGTTDNVALAFRTNNIERMRILNTGNVAIGTTGGAVNQLNVVISPTSTNSNSAIYGSNSYSTPSSNAHGVYGLTSNIDSLAAGVFGHNNSFGKGAGVFGLSSGVGPGVFGYNASSGPSIFGYKNTATPYGNAGRFEINNTGNGADAIFTKSNGTGYAIHAVSTPTFGSKAGLFDGDVVVNGSVAIVDGTQGLGKTLTSDASGNATWKVPLSPIKTSIVSGWTAIANNTNYNYYSTSVLTITPTVSGIVYLTFNSRYNFNLSLQNNIAFGVKVNNTGVLPSTSTIFDSQAIVGWATVPAGAGFGEIPISFTHTFTVTAGTTYYIFVGCHGLNFNQTGANYGDIKLTATLHQSSGL